MNKYTRAKAESVRPLLMAHSSMHAYYQDDGHWFEILCDKSGFLSQVQIKHKDLQTPSVIL